MSRDPKQPYQASDERASNLMVMTRAVEVAELEVRGDGRTLEGTVMVWGQVANIVEARARYDETFQRGAFADADPSMVPLTRLHPRTGADLPIGVTVELDDQPTRLRGSWHVSDIAEGNEVLQLARDRVPLGLSVGFVEVPGGSRWNHNRTCVERVRAILDHIACVRSPAYRDALVTAVRHAQADTDPVTPLLSLARLRR
jgi:phage head maturation protease